MNLGNYYYLFLNKTHTALRPMPLQNHHFFEHVDTCLANNPARVISHSQVLDSKAFFYQGSIPEDLGAACGEKLFLEIR